MNEVLVEFLGTFVLSFFVSITLKYEKYRIIYLFNPILIGLIVAVIIYVSRLFSNHHTFNATMTILRYLEKKITFELLIYYIITQLTALILANVLVNKFL